jgi:hypothetical protein
MFKTVSGTIFIWIGLGVSLLSLTVHIHLYSKPSHVLMALQSIPELFSYPTIYGILAGALFLSIGLRKV